MVQFHSFQNLSEQELAMVLEWRNHPLIRKWMNTSERISWDSHFQFVASLKLDQKRACYLVKEDSRFIGVIQLNNIDTNTVNDFGMYVNPELLKRGAGMRLGFYGVQYSFSNLGYHSLSFIAKRENKDALKLWQVFGIKQVGESNGDSVHGRLLRKDFLTRPQEFKDFRRFNS